MTELFCELSKRVGWEIALILTIIFILMGCLYKLVAWIIAKAEAREKIYLELIRQATEALDKHTEQARDFQTEVKSANEFQRKEHERIIEISQGVCDDHKDHAKILQTLLVTAEGIKDAVGRINGYKG